MGQADRLLDQLSAMTYLLEGPANRCRVRFFLLGGHSSTNGLA